MIKNYIYREILVTLGGWNEVPYNGLENFQNKK